MFCDLYVRCVARPVAGLMMAVSLGGCLESGSSDSDNPISQDNVELSGSVGDGPLVGASMRAASSDGTILAEFQSDSSGGYKWPGFAANRRHSLVGRAASDRRATGSRDQYDRSTGSCKLLIFMRKKLLYQTS